MKLSDKITSLEEALSVPEIARKVTTNGEMQYFRSYPLAYVGPMADGTRRKLDPSGVHSEQVFLPKHMWWFVRECERFFAADGAYGTIIPLLWQTAYLAMWCPKPNKDDPFKVDFFPDARCAIADRPVTTTLAKFLSKCAPIYSDEYIRDIDAAYRAEMSNELEILFGREAIREAYHTGPHSCMSGRFEDADGYEGNHPVDAYDVPGIGLAVGRDANGSINARSIVYINPDDPEDKRAVRVYGDTSLQARLRRNGFVTAGLKGVKLRAIELTSESALRYGDPNVKTLIAPYMDGPAGQHNAPTAYRQLVRFDDDPDHLVPVNEAVKQALVRRAEELGLSHSTNTPNAGGVMHLRTIPRSISVLTCPVTGVVVDLMDNNGETGLFEWVWYDGKPQRVLMNDANRARFCNTAIARTLNFHNSVRYDPNETTTFDHSWDPFIEHDTVRLALNYSRRDPELYPEGDPWVHPDAIRSGRMVRVGEYAYHLKDVVSVLCHRADDDENFIAEEYRVAKGLDISGLTKVHSIKRGRAMYAAPDVKVVKTTTGRLMVPGFHAVVELVDGRWASMHQTAQRSLLGAAYYTLKSEPPCSFKKEDAIVARAVEYNIASYDFRNWMKHRTYGDLGADWETKLIWVLLNNASLFVGYEKKGPQIWEWLKEQAANGSAYARELLLVYPLFREAALAKWEEKVRADEYEELFPVRPGYFAPNELPPLDLTIPAEPEPEPEPATPAEALAEIAHAI